LEESSASLWAMIKQDEQKKRAAKAPPPASQQVRKTADHDKSRLPWPLEGPVLTRFGMQRHPQFGTMVYRRGIEIQAQEGESVRAVRDGQVAYADWYKGYGKLMILDHGNGFYTLYGNLSRIDLNRGAQAVRGQVIGLSGDTGSLKGSKLYFEIRRNGEAQDPLLWLAKK
jgi:septal ring factor EnvC (AmiA/AmiB activator)